MAAVTLMAAFPRLLNVDKKYKIKTRPEINNNKQTKQKQTNKQTNKQTQTKKTGTVHTT